MNWNIWKQIRRASDRANIYPHTGSDLFCNCKENTLCVRRKEKLESWSAHSAMDGSSRKTDLGLELVLTTVVDIQTEQKRCWHDANGALITGFLTCRSFHCCPSHATMRPRPTTWECLGGALFSRKAHLYLIYPFYKTGAGAGEKNEP